jgi:hypothetical protein
MLESVMRFASTIRSPAAFARPALFSTGLDSLLGANEKPHSSAPITTDCLLNKALFGATIKRFNSDTMPRRGFGVFVWLRSARHGAG